MLHPLLYLSFLGFLPCLQSSCSFRSCSFNVSSIFCFSLCLSAFLMSRCYLFTSISKSTFCISGSTLNLQIFSSFMLLKIFLFPLLHVIMFTFAAITTSGLLDSISCYFANHSTKMLIGSLGLEKI